jgi:hypothetical protein
MNLRPKAASEAARARCTDLRAQSKRRYIIESDSRAVLKNDKAAEQWGASVRLRKLCRPGLSKGQKPLQSLEIQPVHLLLLNMLANGNICLGFSAKFTAIKAVGSNLPSGFGINGAMT